MDYILVILLTIELVFVVMAIISSIASSRAQRELNELYDKIIKELEEECLKNYRKYKKALDFKYNIRLIVLNAEANKELCWDTLDKIKNELDKTPIQY